MKNGDSVWVEVSRDKERFATVIDTMLDETYVQFDHGEKKWVDNKCVRDFHTPVATKHDQKKNRLELIPPSGIEGIGRAMTFGATKYSAHNWANGFDWSRLCGSALRHLLAWMSGQDKDPESGLSHLDHLGACVVMLIAHENEKLGTDDRRKV